MYSNMSIKVEDNIATVTFDRANESANSIDKGFGDDLDKVVQQLGSTPGLKGAIFISAKKDFIVGADINLIGSLTDVQSGIEASQMLQALLNRVSALPFPTVAAIHGACLGGGLEFALACDYRIVTDDPRTKLGFPEVQLGLLPGAGGTQRTPRLIGLQAALDLILTGKRLDGKRALKTGLVDACVHPHILQAEARKLVERKKRALARVTPKTPVEKLMAALLEGNAFGRKFMAKKAGEALAKQTKGFYPAPYKILEAIFQGYTESLSSGLQREAKLFGELTQTKESQSLVHLFHATNAVKDHPFIESGKVGLESKVDLVGVVGAGFMGTGIATICAERDIRSLISDPNKDSIGKSLSHVADYFYKKAKQKRLKNFEATSKLFHVSPGLSTQGFESCDVVIEAVFEDLQLKRKILTGLEAKAPQDQIFASNTSALPIADIASVAKHPERVLGMHFFSPVEKMPLLEIVYAPKTAPWVVAKAVKLGQDLGKQVIVVKDSPGFFTTRVLAMFLAEAMLMWLNGEASTEDLDKAGTDFGFPVGPITLIDEVGIDVSMHVMDTMFKAFPDRVKMHPAIEKMKKSERQGRKNNKGFFIYRDGKKMGADASAYIEFDVVAKGTSATAQEIQDRLVSIFVNESARCLEEGIIPTAYEGDVGSVFGIGFPPFRGGPFKYLDHVGVKACVEKLSALGQELGPRFTPAQLLKDYATKDQKFFAKERC